MQQIFGPRAGDSSYSSDSSGELSRDEVAADYPWPDQRSWVRAMMVTSLDGAAAGPDGLSGSISSDADQLVFNAVRRFADSVLVGSGTIRAEKYTPMRAKEEDKAAREARGQLPAPVLTVVSGSLKLPWELPMWAESTHRPIVITRKDVDPERVAEADQYADLIALEEVTPAAIVAALVERGLPRIVCEGGPNLLNDFVRTGEVDELDITVSPTMVGSEGSPPTKLLEEVASFHLVSVLAQDNYLMARYLKEKP
jgi:riboflavin biosynthesis pyrimidine reductase